MVRYYPSDAKYTAGSMLYRGDVAIVRAERSIQFVAKFSSRFTVGINSKPPTVVPGGDLGKAPCALCMLSNTTAIGEVFNQICSSYDTYYNYHRSVVDQFVSEGIDAGERLLAGFDLAGLASDYNDVEQHYVYGEVGGAVEY